MFDMKNSYSFRMLSSLNRLLSYSRSRNSGEATDIAEHIKSLSKPHPHDFKRYKLVRCVRPTLTTAVFIMAAAYLPKTHAQPSSVTVPPVGSGKEAVVKSTTPRPLAVTTPSALTPSATQPTVPSFDNTIAATCRTGGSKTSGGRLLFTVVYQNHRHIYGFDLGSQKVFPLVIGPGDNYAPSISPDGLRIAFISNRTGVPQLFVASWDGSGATQLTTSPLKKGYPSWSSDGSLLHFSGEPESGDTKESSTGNIYSVKSTGGPETQITRFEGRNIAPAIQQDGRAVAYSTNRFWPGWDICLFDITQKKESCMLAGSHSFIKPRISRDGKSLAFVRTQSTSSQIGVLSFANRTGGNEYFSSANHETDPTWGKDDQEIYVSSGASSEDIHSITLKNLKTKQNDTIVTCSYSLKEPTWNAVTQAELDEKRVVGQFKLIKAIESPVNTPQGYIAPYIKADKHNNP
jgi:hypothetical protein